LLIYCDSALLVLRAQVGLFWFPMVYCMVRNNKKPHYHYHVLVCKAQGGLF